MPTLYLSPSTQEFNSYITNDGSEEFYMNLIADAMMPYLRSSGIFTIRNTPQMTAASSIAESNRSDVMFHLALHSNAAPDRLSGELAGSEVYYNPDNTESKRFADIAAKNLKQIYYNPADVRALPTDFLGEVLRTKAPGVLIEFAYHDNIEDANWIKNNIDNIARNVVLSLTQYFGIPLVEPQPIVSGKVITGNGKLNIRSMPSTNSIIVGKIPNGATVMILGTLPEWYVVSYGGTTGYASRQYIRP